MKYHVEADRLVNAPAAAVYALLADYREGHPRVLPRAFTGLTVIAGGTGAGTVIDVGMKAFGKVRTVRGHVTEPEPGRVLEEMYPESNIITRFYVTPVDGGSHVRIWSELESKAGIAGWLERKLVGKYLRNVYNEELRLIEAAALRGAAGKLPT